MDFEGCGVRAGAKRQEFRARFEFLAFCTPWWCLKIRIFCLFWAQEGPWEALGRFWRRKRCFTPILYGVWGRQEKVFFSVKNVDF